jgi:ribonuclease HII
MISCPGRCVVGLDEAGVGCVFGDLCAAAVEVEIETGPSSPTSVLSRAKALVLPASLSGLADSKTISSKKRSALAAAITSTWSFGLGVVGSPEINEIGLAEARRLVFHRALDDLLLKKEADSPPPVLLIVDGTLFAPYRDFAYIGIPKADSLYSCVSAASVLAKSHRDNRLARWCDGAPLVADVYGLRKNMGYVTAEHKAALRSHGFTDLHRNYTIRL